MAKDCPEVSIVVRLLDEQDNIGPLYEQITQTLAGGHSYEIIFIDDGSVDESFAVLEKLQKADAKVRVIRFRRNFGQTAALSAGFAHAKGKIIKVLTSKNPGTAPLLKRFASSVDAMSPVNAEEYKPYYELLSGVIVGW